MQSDLENQSSTKSVNQCVINTRVVCKYIYEVIILKDFSYIGYRNGVIFCLVYDTAFCLWQGFQLYNACTDVAYDPNKDKDVAILFICVILALFCIIYEIKILYNPIPYEILINIVIMIFQEIFFIVAVILFGNANILRDHIIASYILSIFFLLFQLYEMWILYRYWEYILFNYDDGEYISGKLIINNNNSNNILKYT